MDLDQELAVLAHELPPHLHGQVLEADLLGRQVGLEALEAAEEVAIELLLQEAEARLVGLTVARAQAQDEAVDGRAQMMEPRLGVAGWRFVGGDLDPSLEQVEGGRHPVHVEGERPVHAHGRDDGREVADDLPLLLLIGGNHQQRGVDLGDRGQVREGVMLLGELVE